MTQFGYIYRVTNLLNGTVYIGQRTGEFQPWYYGSGVLIRRALAKHGKQNFLLEFVQSAFSRPDLDLLEIVFIADARANGRTYNIRDGGLGSLFCGVPLMKGKKHTDESKAKMSLARTGPLNHMFGRGDKVAGKRNGHYGKKQSADARRKIGDANKKHRGVDHGNFGLVRSDETRARISAGKKGQVSRRGWVMTDEQKQKISAARKAKFAAGFKMTYSEETRRRISEGRKRYWAEKKKEAA